MKRGFIQFCACVLIAGNLHSAAIANAGTIVTVETVTEEWIEEEDGPENLNADAAIDTPHAIAQYGPFKVVAPDRVALIGSIETDTPEQFKAMLADYPAIKQIDIIDCSGTGDDAANFAIARMIRSRAITTYIPVGGSARSGGVELFLAGAKRRAAPGAEFAVHSWRDEDGREAKDYPANARENLEYINFYKEIGMDDAKAKAFYAMTNSVPHSGVLYLKRSDIARFAALD